MNDNFADLGESLSDLVLAAREQDAISLTISETFGVQIKTDYRARRMFPEGTIVPKALIAKWVTELTGERVSDVNSTTSRSIIGNESMVFNIESRYRDISITIYIPRTILSAAVDEPSVELVGTGTN